LNVHKRASAGTSPNTKKGSTITTNGDGGAPKAEEK